MSSKRKNKILSDYNVVYYASNFRMRIYGRDQHEDNKITVRIEFKEKLPNCIPHLLNKVEPSFLSEFFTGHVDESNRKIYFRCEIVNDNKIRNQVTKFQLRKLKNVNIEEIIKFVSSEKYQIEDNPEELMQFLKDEYNKEWGFYYDIYSKKKEKEEHEKIKKEEYEKIEKEEHKKKEIIERENKLLNDKDLEKKMKEKEIQKKATRILKLSNNLKSKKLKLTPEQKEK